MTETSEVKLHFLDYWKVIKQRAGLITLVFLLVMVTAGITTYFMPRKYLAKVTMEIRSDDYKLTPMFEGRGRPYDPQFVATQFQILRKWEILQPVIEQLDLVKTYSADGPRLTEMQVFGILVRSLDMQEVRNTGLIEIGAWHTDRQVAADIANTIAVVYRNNRLENLEQATNRGLAQFQDEVSKQRKVVEDYLLEASKVRERDGITDPDPENAAALLATSDRQPVAAEGAVNDQRIRVTALRTNLARMETLKPEELKEALRNLGVEDATVSTNVALLLQSRVEEINLLNSGLGVNHPRIKALRAKIIEYNSILSEALQGIRRSEATKLQIAEETLLTLEKRLEDTIKEAVAKTGNKSAYVEAKAKYLNAKRILEAAEMRLSTARMEQRVDIDPVRIWERAMPPLGPDSPPVKQYLVFAAFMGLVMGVLLAFFIEYLDTSVKTLDDVERFLQMPVLAVIPKDDSDADEDQRRSP